MSDGFIPPEPRTGSSLKVWARRGPNGQVIADSIISDEHGLSTTPRTISGLIKALGVIRGLVWTCGCAALGNQAGAVTQYDRCPTHAK